MTFLFERKHPAILGVVRIILGIFVFLNLVEFRNYFINSLVHSKFHFRYDFFEWVTMIPENYLVLFFAVALIFSALFVLGIWYRISAVALFLMYTYCLLVDIGHYNNHYYLISLLLFAFIFIDGNKWGTIRSTKSSVKDIPNWQIWLLKTQLLIVYVFGAISKMDSDWLNGFPIKYWLYNRSMDSSGAIQGFLQSESLALFLAWSGLIFDALICWLLLSKKWRRFALIPLVLFHLSNYFLWSIGHFPWIMILLTLVFFEPDFAERIITRIKAGFGSFLKHFFSYFNPRKFFSWISPFQKFDSNHSSEFGQTKKSVVILLSFWLLFQLFVPLRHLFYKGYPQWSGEGQLFAWRMMLTEEVCAIRLQFEEPENHKRLNIDLAAYLNPSQIYRLGKSPHMMLKFVHFISEELKTEGGIQHPVIHLEMYKSVNERPPRTFNNTRLNYAVVEDSPWKSAAWILDWSPKTDQPSFVKETSNAWRKFSNKNESRFIDDFY